MAAEGRGDKCLLVYEKVTDAWEGSSCARISYYPQGLYDGAATVRARGQLVAECSELLKTQNRSLVLLHGDGRFRISGQLPSGEGRVLYEELFAFRGDSLVLISQDYYIERIMTDPVTVTCLEEGDLDCLMQQFEVFEIAPGTLSDLAFAARCMEAAVANAGIKRKNGSRRWKRRLPAPATELVDEYLLPLFRSLEALERPLSSEERDFLSALHAWCREMGQARQEEEAISLLDRMLALVAEPDWMLSRADLEYQLGWKVAAGVSYEHYLEMVRADSSGIRSIPPYIEQRLNPGKE